MKASYRSEGVEYAIRDVVVPAMELIRKGATITNFNIGDPNKYDFKTPAHMLDALCSAAKHGDMGYAPSEGIPELREEILAYEHNHKGLDTTIDDIIVSDGVSEGIQMLMGATINKGDEVLIPGPAYSPYTSQTKYFDGTPVIYNTIEEENWAFDVEDIRKKITDRTKSLVLINPNNPTGAMLKKGDIKEIIDICGEHDIYVISDEIYDRIIYDGEHHSPTTYSKDVPVVLINGFSKVYLVPGWRIGYLAFQDPEQRMSEIIGGVKKYSRLRICSNTPCQMACIEALRGPQGHIDEMVSKLRGRRDYMHKRFNEIEGIECQKPQGAFYMFPKLTHPAWKSDKEFVLDILHQCHILFVHGSGFSIEHGSGHFRAVFLPPNDMTEEALGALERYMDKKW